jgi:hypothetical protein
MASSRPRLDRRSLVTVTFMALLLVLAVAAGRPQAATAGGPGVWTDISGPVGSLLVQPDSARGADGALHVVWSTSGSSDSLRYRPVSAAGVAGSPQTLASDWGAVNNPAIIYGPAAGELRVYDGGQSPGLTLGGLFLWSSSDGGATFALRPGVVSGPGGLAYQSPMTATLTPAGAFQAWFNSDVVVHRGDSPGADYDVNDAGPDGWCPAFGFDGASSTLYVVWASNATGANGLRFRRIDQATGDAVGPSAGLAKSTTAYSGNQEFSLKDTRTPVAGLVGQPAVLVAYPTGYPSSTTVRVWRLTPAGVPASTVLAGGGGEKNVTAIAADPNGRAWVVWSVNSGSRQNVFAVRSNVGATAWGTVVSLKGPTGTDTLWQLAASAQSDRVDVLAQYQKGSDNAIYHAQLLAGLKVTVSPSKVKAGKKTTVQVTVTDAGAGVAGAKVTIGKKSGTTSAAGVAKIKVTATKAGTLKVTVKKTGYATGSATLRVKR